MLKYNRISCCEMKPSDKPEPGSSPLELLKKGKFWAGEKDFELLLPHMRFVVEVS